MPQSAEKLRVNAGEVSASAPSAKFFDEMRAPDGAVRPSYAALADLLDGLSIESLVTKQSAAEELFRRLGITFAVLRRRGLHGAADPVRSPIREFAERFRPSRVRNPIETAHDVMIGIVDAVEYSPGETHVHTTERRLWSKAAACVRIKRIFSALSTACLVSLRAMSAVISPMA